jgi:acyl carrier protein phosphodiesterase
MISDFIKGKKQFDYPVAIHNGITLHRAIDTFTDEHPATKEAKTIFRPHYRLYSGAFTDVVFDYFLANSPDFTDDSLFHFTQQVYQQLSQHQQWMPTPFLRMFPYMESQNWLYNYRTDDGMRNSLAGLVRRAAYLTESDTAFQLFLDNKPILNDCFTKLWKELKPFTATHLESLRGH